MLTETFDSVSCSSGVHAVIVFFAVNTTLVARWHNGESVGLAINTSWVEILLGAKLRNNLGQVVHTYVPLSPSSIAWYRPRDGDALRLGR